MMAKNVRFKIKKKWRGEGRETTVEKGGRSLQIILPNFHFTVNNKCNRVKGRR